MNGQTSDRRRALCGAIVNAGMDKDRPDHAEIVSWLRGELDALPFTSRSDAGLVAMAEHRIVLVVPVGMVAPAARPVVPPDVLARMMRLSPALFDDVETYLCPDCRDERLTFDAERGGFVRCQRCNRLHDVDDEGEITKRRRR